MSDLGFVAVALAALVVWQLAVLVRHARREHRSLRSVLTPRAPRRAEHEDLNISIVARGAWKASLAAAYTQGPSAVVIRVRELVVLALALALVAGTQVLVAVDAFAGELACAAAVLVLAYGMPARADDRAVQRLNLALRALALVPLSTVLAAAVLHPDVSRSAGVVVVAVVIVWLALRTAPVLEVGRASLFAFPLQSVPLMAGYLLGLVGYFAGAPALVPRGAGPGAVVVALVAAVMAAFAEELVVRGVIQRNLQRCAGRLGVVLGTCAAAATYAAFHSAAVLLLMLVAGLVFANAVMRTGATGAVALGHAALIAGASIVWPLLLGREHPTWVSQPVIVAGLGAGALLALAILLRGRGASLVVRRSGGPPARPRSDAGTDSVVDWFASAPTSGSIDPHGTSSARRER